MNVSGVISSSVQKSREKNACLDNKRCSDSSCQQTLTFFPPFFPFPFFFFFSKRPLSSMMPLNVSWVILWVTDTHTSAMPAAGVGRATQCTLRASNNYIHIINLWFRYFCLIHLSIYIWLQCLPSFLCFSPSRISRAADSPIKLAPKLTSWTSGSLVSNLGRATSSIWYIYIHTFVASMSNAQHTAK